MASPFPGMDPFIESGGEWEDFHFGFLNELANCLVSELRPRYIVRRQKRVYVEHDVDPGRSIYPDDSVVAVQPALVPDRRSPAGTSVLEPVTLTLPMPEPREEIYLTLVDREDLEVVTIIEMLSPSNKRDGGDGRLEYLKKRDEVLASDVHLVELDLLRGGQRPPTREPLPQGDYFAFISRSHRRPRVDVFHWSLRDALPPIPIPLRGYAEETRVSLQEVFQQTYFHSGYDYSLDYQRELSPPVSAAELRWIESIVASRPQDAG